MKKIILAIFTIMLAVAIFGCGKTAAGTGRGSSGGGGNTGSTFSVSGTMPAELLVVAGFNAQSIGAQVVPAGAEVKIYEYGKLGTRRTAGNVGADGKFNISNLDTSKAYVLKIGDYAALAGKPRRDDTARVTVDVLSTTIVEKIVENVTLNAILLEMKAAQNGQLDELITVIRDLAAESTPQEIAELIDEIGWQLQGKQPMLTVLAWHTKTIDGNVADWANKYTVLFDNAYRTPWAENPRELSYNSNTDNFDLRITDIPEIGDAVDNVTVKSIKVARDANYLYLLWEITGEFASGIKYDVRLLPAPGEKGRDFQGNKILPERYGHVYTGINIGGNSNHVPYVNGRYPNDTDDSNFSGFQGAISTDKKFFEVKVSIEKIRSVMSNSLLEAYDYAYTLEARIIPESLDETVVDFDALFVRL
jgi:hypothetical protein